MRKFNTRKISVASGQLLHVIPRSMRVIRGELRAAASPEFSVPQFRILVHLKDGPLNNRQLAETQGVSVAGMSRMADGLVRRGLIARIDAAHDRRQIHLVLTKKGRSVLDHLWKEVEGRMEIRLSKLSAGRLKELAKGLAILEEVFQ